MPFRTGMCVEVQRFFEKQINVAKCLRGYELSASVVCMILVSAVLVELPTCDGQTDRLTDTR